MNWNDIYFELRCALPREAAEIITRAVIDDYRAVNRLSRLCKMSVDDPMIKHFMQIEESIRDYVRAVPLRFYHHEPIRQWSLVGFINVCQTPDGLPAGLYKDTDSLFVTQKMAAAVLPHMLQRYRQRDDTPLLEAIPQEMCGQLALRGRQIEPVQQPRKIRAADLGQPTRRQRQRDRCHKHQ